MSCWAQDSLPWLSKFPCFTTYILTKLCFIFHTGCYFPCPQVYQPVCGSDGKTYGNTCKLSLAACQSGIAGSIRKSYDGPCGTRKIRRKRIGKRAVVYDFQLNFYNRLPIVARIHCVDVHDIYWSTAGTFTAFYLFKSW